MNQDRLRQLIVTVSGVLCVHGTLVGTGVIGTRVAESSGGQLSAEATLIAPAGPAFSIWSVIYLGLLGYVVWQWLPRNATRPRLRETGYLAAASMVLNAVWLLVTQQGWIALSVLVIVVLLGVLARMTVLLHTLARSDAGAQIDGVERVLVDGTFGLYLGWVSVATCANVAAALVAAGVPANGTGPVVATVVVLAAVAAVAALYAARMPGYLTIAAAIVWGLCWIAVGRLANDPRSATVGIAAPAAAGLTAVVFGRSLSTTSSEPRRTTQLTDR